MKDLFKYSLIGLTISPIIILAVIYLVSFLFILSVTGKNDSFSEKMTDTNQTVNAIIMIIAIGLKGKFGNNDEQNNQIYNTYYDNYL